MSPISPGNIFQFDPYSRPGAAECVWVHYVKEEEEGWSDSWGLDPGETFLLLEEPCPMHTSARGELMQWLVLSRGRTGCIFMSEKARRAMRLVSQTDEGSR